MVIINAKTKQNITSKCYQGSGILKTGSETQTRQAFLLIREHSQMTSCKLGEESDTSTNYISLYC